MFVFYLFTVKQNPDCVRFDGTANKGQCTHSFLYSLLNGLMTNDDQC